MPPEPGHAAHTKWTRTTGAGSAPHSDADVRPGARCRPRALGGVASDSAANSHGGACSSHYGRRAHTV